MAELQLHNLTKRFGEFLALDGLTLRVEDGELLVLVGPSGCGKTTALRLIAGLERPTSGEIRIGDRSVRALSAKDRDVAMVFQDYALYPHWDVYRNLAFSLQLRGVPGGEIRRRVTETACLLGIERLLQRRPAALSGGEQQRVALGRALVRRPAVFLLDEPFSSLDAPLREGMRRELALLHQRFQTTTLHVTHDQDEAMQLGRRIAVLHEGRIQQLGPPLEVYQRPANRRVAEFIGSPPMNFFAARFVSQAGILSIDAGDFRLPLPENDLDRSVAANGRAVTLGIRAEHLGIGSPRTGTAGIGWPAAVLLVRPLGTVTLLELKSASHQFTVRVPPGDTYRSGQVVPVTADGQDCHLFDSQTGESLSSLTLRVTSRA